MGKKTRITFPDGAVIEIDQSFNPDQIKAVIDPFVKGPTHGSFIDKSQSDIPQRTFIEIWNSSKKEKLALFIRNSFSENIWISSKMILDEQINNFKSLFLGERPALGTYLKRLFEEEFLDRKFNGRQVYYRQSEKMISDYPRIPSEEFSAIIINSLNQ